jgi:hypothetical protein
LFQTEPPLNHPIAGKCLERQYPAQGNEPEGDNTALLLPFSPNGRKVDMRQSQPGAYARDKAKNVTANIHTF